MKSAHLDELLSSSPSFAFLTFYHGDLLPSLQHTCVHGFLMQEEEVRDIGFWIALGFSLPWISTLSHDFHETIVTAISILQLSSLPAISSTSTSGFLFALAARSCHHGAHTSGGSSKPLSRYGLTKKTGDCLPTPCKTFQSSADCVGQGGARQCAKRDPEAAGYKQR